MAIVLDASATLAWLVERSLAVEAELSRALLLRLYSEEALVPALWYPEVTNGILLVERRQHTAPSRCGSFLQLVAALEIATGSIPPAAVQQAVLGLARTHGLTGYDAVYLELALRTKFPLATFDRKLAAGVAVFGDAQ
jgi:predicted nucleic acid-binding protein